MADTPAFDPTQYPRFKFHKTLGQKVVADPTEESQLGPGWVDKPFPEEPPKPDQGLPQPGPQPDHELPKPDRPRPDHELPKPERPEPEQLPAAKRK